MKIGYWQKPSGSCLNPIFSLVTLTLWAMPIATAVVTISDYPTTIASLFVSAQNSGSALLNVSKGLCLYGIEGRCL